ncbi:hypothetical protein BDW67DRAFT_178537 [Aspergillus spinulosporus]
MANEKLTKLSVNLLQCFGNAIIKVYKEIPLLFAPTYLLVLIHGDLCETNVLAEAKILPFRMLLWGVLNLLGFIDSRGWHYHGNSSELETAFWERSYQDVGEVSSKSQQAIKVAERAGLLLYYGFRWDNGVRERIVTEQDSLFRCLDAFLHCLED